MTLGDFVRGESGLDVVEAETALVTHISPVAVVVIVTAGATRFVACLER